MSLTFSLQNGMIVSDMWEMRIARPFGKLSTRKLLVFVAGLLATIFSFVLLAAPTAHAAPDAKWNGTEIVYQEKAYTRTDDGKANDPRGVPEGSMVFTYVDVSVWPRKAHYIFFPSDTDANAATQAHYLTVDYSPPNTFENVSEITTITIQAYESQNETTTSCNQEGIGWIICPLTNWLAKGMDYLYTALSGFLEVRPAQTTTDNALYRAWSFMRNTANVLFVIGFLVVIYSQVTSFGLSNYNIKKMLPRLVIAAILVNVSYWICAIAIDVSNILGYSIQDIFINIRQNLVGSEGNTWDLVSWESVTGAILTGGAGAVGLVVGAHAFAAGAGSSIILLLPTLVGVLMTVLVALLIMAARQAIITILLVVSPLAFVAFLLPNTEKYFEKWRSVGTTMLVMFPIFSVIFGGSQMAGALIIQNADSINLIILGLAVQVAPLIITPMLIRFSGSLLGRIAGVINNPNKGVIDRTRKWAEERAGQMKSRQIAKGQGFLANRARNIDARRRNREGWQKANDAMAEGNWSNTSKASDIQQYAMKAADIKEIGDSRAQTRYNASKATSAAMQDLDIKARAAKLDVDLSKAKIDANWEEFLAGDTRNIITPEGLSMEALKGFAYDRKNAAESLRDRMIDTRVETHRGKSAQGEQLQIYANRLSQDAGLRKQAAGIDVGGAAKVEAAALSDILEAKNKTLAAGVELLKNRALKDNMTAKTYSKTIVEKAIAGDVVDLSPIEIEAAYDFQAKDGQISNLEASRLSIHVDQEMLSRVLARNADIMKQKGGFHLQDEPKLAIKRGDRLDDKLKQMDLSRAATLGDTSADSIKALKQGWIKDFAKRDNLRRIITTAGSDNADLRKAYNSIYQALNNPQIRATINDREEYLLDIEKALYDAGYRPSQPPERES